MIFTTLPRPAPRLALYSSCHDSGDPGHGGLHTVRLVVEQIACGQTIQRASLVGLVPDKSDNHAVEVEEEHDQVEAKLDE